ncbi:MAG: hypothetical protein LC649_09745 [Bacteroidales bacterium]|nr:hypothetical protein [Bacteroidales bacterium]
MQFRPFTFRLFTLCASLLLTTTGFSQDSSQVKTFDFARLSPIVQIFSNAGYDPGAKRYDFAFGRAHLGLQYNFNERWSTKIIIDRGRATSVGNIVVTDSAGHSLNVINNSSEGSYYTMFLKFASLQWKVTPNLSLESGAILQNHYITQEKFWGQRYVAPTFQDIYWSIPSSDIGFTGRLKINRFVSIDAAVTNGEGPRIKQDSKGKIKIAGGIDINFSDFITSRVYYHNRQAHRPDSESEHMISVFAGLNPGKGFRMGGEFNYIKNLNYNAGVVSYGYSVYSVLRITEKSELFGRYDKLIYNLPEIFSTPVKGNGSSVIGGISFSPVEHISFSFNFNHWNPEKSTGRKENVISFSTEYKF